MVVRAVSRLARLISIPSIHCTCSFTRMVNLTHPSGNCWHSSLHPDASPRIKDGPYWRKAHVRSFLQHQHALGMENVALDEGLIDHAGQDRFDVL